MRAGARWGGAGDVAGARCSLTEEPSPPSFNEPVGAQQYFVRERQAERLRGLDIDHQLELDRLLHRKVAGLGALQYLAHVVSTSPVEVGQARPVGQQPAGGDEFKSRECRCDPVLGGERDELGTAAEESPGGMNADRVDALAREELETH